METRRNEKKPLASEDDTVRAVVCMYLQTGVNVFIVSTIESMFMFIPLE